MKVSYSKLEKYEQCGQKYDLHYNKKLRPASDISSALFFGTKLGMVLQEYCLRKKKNLKDEEHSLAFQDPHAKWDNLWLTVEHLNKTYALPNSKIVSYFKSDFQFEILTEEDLTLIDQLFTQSGYSRHDLGIEDILERINPIPKNILYWVSLKRKGHMLIDRFITEIFPNVLEVFYIEKAVSLMSEAEEGQESDEYEGFIDMICSYSFEDGVKTTIFDFKTSSTPYPMSKLDQSRQLILYDSVENVGHVGYLVAVKKISVGPRTGIKARWQVLSRDAADHDKILEKMGETISNIKSEIYEKASRDVCNFSFGKKCEYYGYCYRGSMEGLTDVTKK